MAASGNKTLAAAVQQQDLVPYHQYRARQRRDASMEGESVWDEELEEAFMEGKLSCGSTSEDSGGNSD